jgi:prevent-host-death family protein
MAIYAQLMAISVTELKQQCLTVVRRVERTGESVTITRRGRAVARLSPSREIAAPASLRPWQRLRAARLADCSFTASESVLVDSDFEALR